MLDWKYFFNKLPDTGDVWEFENVHWGRNGGFGWNGTKTIHGRSTWGHLVFQMEPEALIKIKRRIVFDALQNFKKEQVTNATIHGIISLMQDNVLGDPEFFKAKVQPLLKELQQYEALVKYDMSDADVENVFKNAVPYWNKIDYKILEMRRKYLEEKISNQD